jgi:hypothetical protein
LDHSQSKKSPKKIEKKEISYFTIHFAAFPNLPASFLKIILLDHITTPQIPKIIPNNLMENQKIQNPSNDETCSFSDPSMPM